MRTDLHISRQRQGSESVYVVHDPVAFRTHRMSLEQYRIFAALDDTRSFGENFDNLATQGLVTADDPVPFSQLLQSMSRLGLVTTSNLNGTQLFAAHQRMQQAKSRGRMLSFLFLQIPLVNPDRFLSRTMGRVRWLFSRNFGLIWLLGMLSSLLILATRWTDVVAPFNGLLASRNLPFLWLTFVVLKIWHELGHGYACKAFGGSVPEMGTILIAGTPAAYVDATAAWSFPERWKRLLVMAGGMYFESLVFIVAVFVWAAADSPMIRSCAYQLFVLSSMVTLLFNANPLMKFDGYFILSELTGIQNLRPRSDRHLRSFVAHKVLGLSRSAPADSGVTQILMMTYGIAAAIYRMLLVISIAAMIATKFPIVGLALAVFHIATTAGIGTIQMFHWLMFSPETAPVRMRSRLVAALLFLGIPLAAALVPVPFGVFSSGLVVAEHEYFLNATEPGIVDTISASSGSAVAPGTPLVRFRNVDLDAQLKHATMALANSVSAWRVAATHGPVESAIQRSSVEAQQRELEELERRSAALTIQSPADGVLARTLDSSSRGQHFSAGQPVAIVVAGETSLRTWLTQEQLGSASPEPGTIVSVQIPGRSLRTISATIIAIEPAAEQTLRENAISQFGGGEILVRPDNGRPMEPVFQVDLKPDSGKLSLRERGTRVQIRFPRKWQSFANWALRSCTRFVQKLLV
ncbi:MAG: efflux RND transporter periplasmic adaptor subunit [Planctomycetaceae bacterium]|nr:efflux RND transporter periplasmic adaptor subunit [Planctomycetaceae bacterium]